MNLNKAAQRDKERRKRRHGHRVSGKSIFIIVGVQVKKAEQSREERNHGR